MIEKKVERLFGKMKIKKLEWEKTGIYDRFFSYPLGKNSDKRFQVVKYSGHDKWKAYGFSLGVETEIDPNGYETSEQAKEAIQAWWNRFVESLVECE